MTSFPKSRRTIFSRRSSCRRNNVPLLQAYRPFCSDSWSDETEEDVKDTNAASTSKGSDDKHRQSSTGKEGQILTQINELSQDESPLLRELAQRLGANFNIETPKCFKTFKHPYADLHLANSRAERWEELQGCNNWKDLLEPDFDSVLKAEVLRYGEFAQATYDAFDSNKDSAHYGICKYTKTDLLKQVGLPNRGYEITNFIYASTDFHLRKHSFSRSERARVEVKSQNSEKDSEEGIWENIERCEHSNENSKDGFVKCKQCSENSGQCNWMGFVAVCTSPEEIARLGRRDILIAWRGSVTKSEWIADFRINSEAYMSPSEFGPDHASSHVRLHKGFLHIYRSTNVRSRYNQKRSARDHAKDAIQALVKKYRDEGKLSITVTGHSLGSALATLCAYDIAECEWNLLSGAPTVPSEWHSKKSRHEIARNEDGPSSLLQRRSISEDKFRRDRAPITLYSFGGPRVGNKAFRDKMENLGVAVLRVMNKDDIVTKLPGLVNTHLQKTLHQIVTQLPTYEHVGVRLMLHNEKSEYLKKTRSLDYLHKWPRAHSLETYLHLVDSYQGIEETLDDHHKTFRGYLLKKPPPYKYKDYKKTFRNPAFVNKHQDLLKLKYNVPPGWWQEKNKGLVISDSGELNLPERDESVIH